MLFKARFIEPILQGRKTETRRLWKQPMVRAGNTYGARSAYNADAFATLKILYVRREKLGSIDSEGIRREGCETLEEFKRIWADAYGSWDPDAEVFVIGFSIV